MQACTGAKSECRHARGLRVSAGMHGGYAAPSELDGKIHSAVKLDCIICAEFLELFALLCGQPFQQFFLPCCIIFFCREKRERGVCELSTCEDSSGSFVLICLAVQFYERKQCEVAYT